MTYNLSKNISDDLLARIKPVSRSKPDKMPCFSGTTLTKPLDLLPAWSQEMAVGGIYKRPSTPKTIGDYTYYIEKFLKQYDTLSVETLRQHLNSIPPEHYAKKDKIYKALRCFAKYLIHEGQLDARFLEDAKQYKPIRHLPPKQTRLDETDVEKLIKACDSPLDTLLVTLLFKTGLRASEACSITRDDIDLERGTIIIREAKWGSARIVGISKALHKAIVRYLKSISTQKKNGKYAKVQGYVLKNRVGKQMDRNGVYQRIERLAKKAGVKAHPHALRSAFATVHHIKGLPIGEIQLALGLKNIQTTQGYLRIDQERVIESMRRL